MKIRFDMVAGAYVAQGNGVIRPIIVESITRTGARLAYVQTLAAQQLEKALRVMPKADEPGLECRERDAA